MARWILRFNEVAINEVASISLFCLVFTTRASGRSETGAYSKPELHKNKGFFLMPGSDPKELPGVTHWLLHSRYRRARGNRYK